MSEVVFFLLVALAVVTVVGHVLWLILAALFRVLFRASDALVRPSCPGCGYEVDPKAEVCWRCRTPLDRLAEDRRSTGAQPPLPPPPRPTEVHRPAAPSGSDRTLYWLNALHDQLRMIEARGGLEADVHQRLLASIEAEIDLQIEALERHAAAEEAAEELSVEEESPDELPEIRTAPPVEQIVIPADLVDEPDVVDEREPADVQTRVEQYVARRAAAVDDEPDSAPTPPARQHASLSQLLSAFMEKKNIRWGELVGGLLIVCCSIALVISFWAEIAQRPLLKFVVFNGVVAALFGVGFYTHRRWKLETTSDGVLMIATLLVPLNFLAIAAFTGAAVGWNVLTIGGEALSAALFGTLTFLAAKIFLPRAERLLVVGILFPSLAMLLVRRYVSPEASTMVMVLLAAAVLIVYCTVNGWLLSRMRRLEMIDEAAVNHLFKLLGITTFASALPLGLILVKAGPHSETLRTLAPLFTLLAAPSMATGALLWLRIHSKELFNLRLAGTAVGVFGVLVALASVPLAWPHPASMIVAATLTGSILLVVAAGLAIPQAHLPAAVYLLLAAWLGLLVVGTPLAWNEAASSSLLQAALSRISALGLVPLSALPVLVAAWFAWAGRRLERNIYLLAAGGVAAISLALVSWLGAGVPADTSGAVYVYAIYCVALLAAGFLLRHPALAWAALVLGQAALVQGLVFTFAEYVTFSHPWLVAFLLGAALSTLLAAVSNRRAPWRAPLAVPGQNFALAASAVAAALIARIVPEVSAADLAIYVASLTSLWLVLSLLTGWTFVFAACQAGAVGTVFLTATAGMQSRPRYSSLARPWTDPWSLQIHGLALLGLAFAWLLLRSLLARHGSTATNDDEPSTALTETKQPGWIDRARELSNSSGLSLDSVLAVGAIVLATALAVYSAAPGTAQELSPRVSLDERVVPPASRFAVVGFPHEHAGEVGTWLLVAGTLALLLVSQRLEKQDWKLLGALLLTASVMPLAASRFESQVAAGSALRWLSAFYLLVGSVAVWMRNQTSAILTRAGLLDPTGGTTSLRVRQGVLALAFLPLVAMLAYVEVVAFRHYVLPPPTLRLLIAAAVFLVVTAVLAIVASNIEGAKRAPAVWFERAKWFRTLLWALGAAPLFAVSTYALTAALKARPLLGPEPDSVFVQMGLAVSYALPLGVTAATFVGYALRERSSAFAWAAGLVLNVTATTGFLLSLVPGTPFDVTLALRLVQLNAAVAALFAFAWLTVARRYAVRSPDEARVPDRLLLTHASFAFALHLIALSLVIAAIFFWPRDGRSFEAAGSFAGWASFGVALAAWMVVLLQDRRQVSVSVFATVLLAVAAMFACSAAHWDATNWLAYNTFLSGLLVVGWLLFLPLLPGFKRVLALGLGRASDLRQAFFQWSRGVACLAVVFALRAIEQPGGLWWTLGPLLVVAALFVAMALAAARRGFVHAAAGLVMVAVNCWWMESPLAAAFTRGSLVRAWYLLNVLALASPAGLWAWVEHRIRPAISATPRRKAWWPMHWLAATVSLVAMLLFVGLGLAADFAGGRASDLGLWPWLALAATTVAIAVCLWDHAARFSVAGLYLLLALAAGLTLDQFNLEPRWLFWTGVVLLAAFSLGTSYLWSQRAALQGVADRLRIPRKSESPEAGLAWLLPANCTLAILVVVLAFCIQVSFDEVQLRITAAQAAVAQAFAVGLLAYGTRRTQLQFLSLTLGVAGAVALSWSPLAPGDAEIIINRLVATLAALVAMAALYGVGLTKIIRAENEWTQAAQRLTPFLAGGCLLAVASALGYEIVSYVDDGSVPISPTAILVLAAALLGLVGASLAAALIPGRDPLRLSERGRTAYVYAAEAMLAVLFMHIRLTLPWLFSGVFQQYWPMVVIAIAFFGVGLSEFFRRKGRMVLAEPLERTGALLPLLPVLGFWAMPGRVHFSLVLLAIGGLYGVLAVTRRSFGFSILAALAANGGLWYLLNQTGGFGLLEHPQVWLIPPAVCLLVAAYLNRDQLNESQLTSIRYIASIAIYVSSTADIFLTGVAQAPWLPLVLAALSLAGIFAGILMQVRSFLFLGLSFLMLSLFTIIWYAAVDLDQTWLWAASGIVTGILIIAVFAAFEKKRQEVLQLVEELKHWKA